jgi:addiction module RelE/StbE family toxin
MIAKTESSFKRSFKKLIKKNPQLEEKILETLNLLVNDPFTPSLKSHKLTGQLDGWWSCSVSYDCRIIFGLTKDAATDEDTIVLFDLGSHDEGY